eukprot:Rmarinus@m.16331
MKRCLAPLDVEQPSKTRPSFAPKSHSCPHEGCQYVTSYSFDLARHIRYKHTGEKPFKCTFCSYASAESSGLKRHIRTRHTTEKPFKCTHCPYATAVSSNLQKHLRSRHSKPVPVPVALPLSHIDTGALDLLTAVASQLAADAA